MTAPVASREREAAPTPVDWDRALDDVLAGARSPDVHFQPIVDLTRGVVAGYEALARFPGPPQAAPDRWLAEAAKRGSGVALECLALARALSSIGLLPLNTFLTVNVSPATLASAAWTHTLSDYDRLDRLVIEVTEHAAIEDYDEARRALDAARGRGALFAVDDTGSGYASMQHVLLLRPDFVKLDRAFVTACDQDPARVALIEAIGSLAATLDAWLIAEGVETAEELHCLMRLGVPLAQGWLLGKAEPAWAPILTAGSTAIRMHQRRASDGLTVSDLVGEWPAIASDVAAVTSTREATLLLDADCRPVRWYGSGITGADPQRPLVVKADTPLRATARRAMTRDLAQRFLPVVCTDDEGRYLGVIRVERIVERLARQP